jgi:predicted SprT family Zn-dependent metalloprotease
MLTRLSSDTEGTGCLGRGKREEMKKTAIAPDNYDLFDGLDNSESVSELPSIAELQRMFDIYNREYFDGRLPKVKIKYSKRMLVAGGYFPQKKEIRISEKYHTYFPDEVYDTLKHEMIHLIHFRHNAAFKKTARRIGASLRANDHPALRRPPRYIYICPHCFTEYPRNKRLRMASCGRCSKGKFDPRFKLVLKRSIKRPGAL